MAVAQYQIMGPRYCSMCQRGEGVARFKPTHKPCVECIYAKRRQREAGRSLAPAERMRRTEYARQWRASGGWRKQLDADLRRLYGITADDYDAMLESQGGGCGICGRSNVAGRRLAVDHDHANGNVRGLLCNSCNRGVGFFADHPGLLAKAIAYLSQ